MGDRSPTHSSAADPSIADLDLATIDQSSAFASRP